ARSRHPPRGLPTPVSSSFRRSLESIRSADAACTLGEKIAPFRGTGTRRVRATPSPFLIGPSPPFSPPLSSSRLRLLRLPGSKTDSLPSPARQPAPPSSKTFLTPNRIQQIPTPPGCTATLGRIAHASPSPSPIRRVPSRRPSPALC